MRKLIAMAVLGVGAVVFSAQAPVHAMPTGNAVGGVVKHASESDNAVEEVGRRHRHWRHHNRHHRHWRHHRHHRGYYNPYYYGGGYGYYPRYYRRPGVRLYFGF